ncbi:hypothetical protein BCR34DRAFT_632080 [Clohesyomyces aquaticus]|uniref:Uncharacterized protein n=1 Tax=Clohesyomyces aquaticus TaxID=1231657 RepID=A0A1Y1ZAF0_9PLEO|nr:hypothetical protein BCR34DRAFT_632080 [Clohesyomyces aquaticus]
MCGGTYVPMFDPYNERSGDLEEADPDTEPGMKCSKKELFKKDYRSKWENYNPVKAALGDDPALGQWDAFQFHIGKQTDDLTLQHLGFLQQIITPVIQPHPENKRDLLNNNLVTYEYLWTLYEPDAEIYSKVDGQDRSYILSSTKLLKRRKMFEALMGTHFKSYRGFYIPKRHHFAGGPRKILQPSISIRSPRLPFASERSRISFYLMTTNKFDDIIEGKGQGIIIFFHGELGVGKTLTAESVAEEMKRPPYAMSAGELGSKASEVEKSLEGVLEISTKWGAFLLVDECDVFLEQRTTRDIERNKLVAVFLRLLEYFKGVVFLTTNRCRALKQRFSRVFI